MRRLRIDLYDQSKLILKISKNDSGKPFSIHFINTYSVGLMYRNSNYRNALSDQSIYLPDGWPIIVLAKLRKAKKENIQQMRGVNLMRTILANSEPGACNHYFIGSTPQNLINLRNELSLHYPQANIVGTYSPPFTKGNEWIHDKSIDFKASIADFVWIGLGTPKQDILMGKIAEYFPNAKAILAVGAAFDFLTQNRKEANQTIITLKLEWLYRLLQEPRRLWKRYTLFMLYFVLASRFVDFKDQ